MIADRSTAETGGLTSFVEQYKLYVCFGGAVLFLLMIGVVVFNIRRNFSKQSMLRTSLIKEVASNNDIVTPLPNNAIVTSLNNYVHVLNLSPQPNLSYTATLPAKGLTGNRVDVDVDADGVDIDVLMQTSPQATFVAPSRGVGYGEIHSLTDPYYSVPRSDYALNLDPTLIVIKASKDDTFMIPADLWNSDLNTQMLTQPHSLPSTAKSTPAKEKGARTGSKELNV